MKFFKKSILHRIVLYYIFLAVIVFAFLFYFFLQGQQTVSVFFLGYVFVVFFLYFFAVCWYEAVRPFKILLAEMKALLTGQKYHRIYTRRLDEVAVMSHFFNQVTESFEKVSLNLREGKRMMSELEIATGIQRDILPPYNPKIHGLEIVAKTRPAAELGGDNFDFITIGQDTYIYVGDVTGHGVPAALVMIMVNTLIHTLAEIYDNPYDIVVKTNKHLKSRIKSTMFMTMLLFHWNHEQQKMSYVGSGHEHIVVYRAATGKCEISPTGGIALGMVADNSKLVKELSLPLTEGDVVIMFSDGLTEGRNMQEEMYGLERLVKAIEQYAPIYGSEGIVHHVAQDYSRFVQDHVQEDDVTLIVMKYVGSGIIPESGLVHSTKWLSRGEIVQDTAEFV